MVTLGVDTHKATHTAVAIDQVGRPIAHATVPATPAGHRELIAWAAEFDERCFALEDVRHLSRGLEGDLIRAGEHVVRVSTHLMVQERRSGRIRGKSDPIDALATARAALREGNLPPARLDGIERELRLLIDHREDYVAERTRYENRLLWDLHELLPGQRLVPRALSRLKHLEAVRALLAPFEGIVADIAKERLEHIVELTRRINALEAEITRRVKVIAPTLLELQGCGPLTAAKIVGETAHAGRFRSRAAYARMNGTAPLPASSALNGRHRLNRGGNRQLNCALHRIAITQIRNEGLGKTYFEHRRELGDSKTEAIRALRRRISDEVFRRLRMDEQSRTSCHPVCVPVAA